MTEVKEQFSWLIAVQKSAIKTLVPTLVAILTFLIANPAILSQILGKWSTMTVLEVVLFLVNMLINYNKNKNLGEEVKK